MNKHWERKIAFRKHRRNLRHMFSNRVLANGVAGIIRLDFDRATIREEVKMMAGQLMTKAHGVIAAVIDHVTMTVFGVSRPCRRGRWGLLPSRDESGQKNQHERKWPKHSPNNSCIVE